jgi:hypothetical protein
MSRCTIICQSAGRLLRADRDEAGVVHLRRLNAAAEATPSEAVAAATAGGARLRGPVWIITDQIQPVVLELEERAVQGLQPAELAGVLAFEVQAFTSLEPDAAAIAWIAFADGKKNMSFWIASMPLSLRAEWEAAVVAGGGRCEGLAHPAALTRSLQGERGSWRRVERWLDLVAVVSHTPSGCRVNLQRTDARRWLDDEVASEYLAGPGITELDSRPLTALDEDEGQLHWLSTWMNVLAPEAPNTAVAPDVPVIRIPKLPVSMVRIVALTVVFVVIAVAGVWLARDTTETRRQAAQRALVSEEQPRQELKDLQSRIGEVKPKAKQALAAQERQREAERRTRERRHRALHTIDALRTTCPPGTIVDELTIDIDMGRIAGRCATQEAAARFATALATSLAQVGYIVMPADSRIDGRVRRFTIAWITPVDRTPETPQ